MWTIVIIGLFALGMWAFPDRHGQLIAGMPADYVITFTVGAIYLVVFGIFGWQMVHPKPERRSR